MKNQSALSEKTGRFFHIPWATIYTQSLPDLHQALTWPWYASGGYQGGRNPHFATALLGISRGTWSDLHTWASLVMLAGVVVHLVLHWKLSYTSTSIQSGLPRTPKGLLLLLRPFLVPRHTVLPTQALVEVAQEKANALVVIRVQF